MAYRKKKHNASEKEMTTTDLLKFVATLVGALAIFIPLMVAIVQYRQSVEQNRDENFRSIVKNLSAEKAEQRLGAASSLGTFINKGDKYYDVAIDILINRLSLEFDYSVLNAIKGSLEKVEKEEYKKVIDKLLDAGRTMFIQRYSLQNYENISKNAFEKSKESYREVLLKEHKSDIEKEMLNNHREMMNQNWESYINRKRVVEEIDAHELVISGFLAGFLMITKSHPIEGLEFYRNNMNYIAWLELDLPNAHIIRSAFSAASIENCNFDGSTIINTTFYASDFKNTNFANCRIEESTFNEAVLINVDFSGSMFRDVFFTGSDLTGTRFENTRGLDPIHFYKAKNLARAIFDPVFRERLEKELPSLTEEHFTEYVSDKTRLDPGKARDLLETIKNLRSLEQSGS